MSAVFVCEGWAVPCRTFSVFVKLSNDLVYPSATVTAHLTVCAARKWGAHTLTHTDSQSHIKWIYIFLALTLEQIKSLVDWGLFSVTGRSWQYTHAQDSMSKSSPHFLMFTSVWTERFGPSRSPYYLLRIREAVAASSAPPPSPPPPPPTPHTHPTPDHFAVHCLMISSCRGGS